jgi:hypothetical protein
LYQPHRLQLVLKCVRRSLAISLLHFFVSLTWNLTTVKKYVFRRQGQFELYNDDQISYEEAIRNADSANELRLYIKLKSKRGEPGSATMEMANLTLHEYKSPEELEAERKVELAAQEVKKRQFEAEQLARLQQEMNQLEQTRVKQSPPPAIPQEKIQLAIE